MPGKAEKFLATKVSLDRMNWRVLMWVAALFFSGAAPVTTAQSPDRELPEALRGRLDWQTDAQDVLLRDLEKDYLDLLRQSRHWESLLEAERLLAETNDNTHWTNYSSATELLRQTRDLAAVPLLLRYMVEHSRRSAAHVMIPAYAKTISLITGDLLESPYEAGPELESRMRNRVQGIVDNWWSQAKQTPGLRERVLTQDQLRTITHELLADVRRDGDFTGSGGRHDSAYGVYHNVYYRLMDHSNGRFSMPELEPGMLPFLLEPAGDSDSAPVSDRFPYESVIVLAELAKRGQRAALTGIGHDRAQPATARLVCLLGLFRAGEPLDTPTLLSLLDGELPFETRLVLLVALRWGGPDAVPTLLQQMEDPNIEIATAAATALAESRPAEAIPRFRNLLERPDRQARILLLSILADYETPASRQLLADLLQNAVDGGIQRSHLDRLLSALERACNFTPPLDPRDEMDDLAKARLALLRFEEQKAAREREIARLRVRLEGLQAELALTQETEALLKQRYQLLLRLQGEDLITADRSEAVKDLWTAAKIETEAIQRERDRTRAELDAREADR